jgi:hypothetical protein
LGEATFAGMGGKEQDAPIPAIRKTAIERLKCAGSGRSLSSGQPA